MGKTLRIAFSLKNTYRVNTILYTIQKLPLVGKHIPDTVYRARLPLILAEVAALIWELFTALTGKALFLLLVGAAAGLIAQDAPPAPIFIHIFLFMTLAGRDNNALSDTDRPTYYAVLLLGLDARRYSLLRFGYAMGKLVLGYLLFGLPIGLIAGVPWWLCLLMGPFAVGVKSLAAAWELRQFPQEQKMTWIEILWNVMGIALPLGAAILIPLFLSPLSFLAAGVIMGAVTLAGVAGIWYICRFPLYRPYHQRLWADFQSNMTQAQDITVQATRDSISLGKPITSHRRGFAYLNELFVKRHRKVLWKPALIVTAIAAGLAAGLLFLLAPLPEERAAVHDAIPGLITTFPLVLYFINRGQAFTQALYTNCDHSLLTYSFYKKPSAILRLFRIRLWQIIKVNLVPGLTIALAVTGIYYAFGGTDRPIEYLLLFASILSINIFFSVHYLTLYYLLQPYNAGSEVKSVPYQIVTGLTYFVCYLLVDLEIDLSLFGGMCILLCLAYCLIACAAVYFLAPKTFRIRT